MQDSAYDSYNYEHIKYCMHIAFGQSQKVIQYKRVVLISYCLTFGSALFIDCYRYVYVISVTHAK